MKPLRAFGASVALLTSSSLAAQAPLITVHGVAYDSLRSEPLKAAVVVVLGDARTSLTDDRGRFQFDSLIPGRHTFVVQHAYLDSLGLPGLSKVVMVTDGKDGVRLAVPSFATLWRGVCGSTPPKDTGFVYGTIRDVARRDPVPDAAVTLSWVETQFDKRQGLRQKRMTAPTRANARGIYAVCGVPVDQWLSVDARTDSAIGRLHFPPANLMVQRRDLLLGNVPPDHDSTGFGLIKGVVVEPGGFGYSDARVVLDDSTETRSSGDGRFVFRDIPPGTHQVEVFALGIMPVITTVHLFRRDTAEVALQLRRVTTLDVVRVTAPSNRARLIAEGIEERRRLGFGYTMDMTELAGYATFFNALSDLPGARAQFRDGNYSLYVPDGRGGECIPAVWIDGHRMTMLSLTTVHPRDVTAVELFARAGTVPLEYRGAERKMSCGALLVWTNFAFRGR